uniref:Condensin complex subunit 1 C-terminal domain-containing protein n=1 Tax=Glossina palpalis gambiensis TaxID=67801 RepID=A0A1B0B5X6_9MUSC
MPEFLLNHFISTIGSSFTNCNENRLKTSKLNMRATESLKCLTSTAADNEDFVRATAEDNVAELYRDPTLQQLASLALVRFMCVSPRVCGSYMPFLMNILSHNKNINIKCSIVIGISELTFRFPNIMEPSTGHFYSTLHNENTELRFECGVKSSVNGASAKRNVVVEVASGVSDGVRVVDIGKTKALMEWMDGANNGPHRCYYNMIIY